MAKLANPIAQQERAVLCVLLNDSHAIIPVMEVLDAADLFSEELHRQTYTAILDLTRASVVPNVYTVSDRAGLLVADLQALATGFSTKLSREVLYTAELVRKDAEWRKVRDAARGVAEVASTKTDDARGLASYCADVMVSSIDDKSDASPAVGEVSKRVDAEIQELATGKAGIPIGARFGFLQDKSAGFRAGHIWMLTAPYKSRKTTLMRNLILGPCRAGASVDIFALEGTESGTYAGLTAMLATERLAAWNLPDEMVLSETYVLRGTRNEAKQQAILETRAELDSWNLRIYDGRKGIGKLEKLLHYIKRDRFIHGLDIFAVDYLQLLGEGDLFERVEATTHKLQQITVAEGLTALILAQLNEATIRADDDSYSPGVKGGGDPAAASDFLIRTKYDGANAPDILTVNLKLARHARPGIQKYKINPQSGLVLREEGREIAA